MIFDNFIIYYKQLLFINNVIIFFILTKYFQELACTKCLNIPTPRTCQHSYDSLSNAYKKYGAELEYLVCESKNVMKNISTLPTTLEKSLDSLQASHDHVKSNVEETFQVNRIYNVE